MMEEREPYRPEHQAPANNAQIPVAILAAVFAGLALMAAAGAWENSDGLGGFGSPSFTEDRLPLISQAAGPWVVAFAVCVAALYIGRARE